MATRAPISVSAKLLPIQRLIRCEFSRFSMAIQNLSIRDALKEDSLFNELSAEDLAKLSGTVEITEYQAGQLIFQKGDPATCCFVLVSGDSGQKRGRLELAKCHDD